MVIKKNTGLKIGDKVKVLNGKYQNKIGYVVRIINKKLVIIKDLNKKIKTVKPSFKGTIGEKQYTEFPIHGSNIKIITN